MPYSNAGCIASDPNTAVPSCTMASSKKKTGLAAELESARKDKLDTVSFRCDAETRDLLDRLVEQSGARGIGEIIRHAVRKLARDEGLLSE
ncbi:MAG: hypothetical protein JWN04_3838 [Myxococcaceae bacterium]|nr:hypothetical protein [Myxococcaceae bacterium]